MMPNLPQICRRLAAACTVTSTVAVEGLPVPKVLLLDIMDTVVKDPFFTHMADYFGLTFEELLAQKHKTAWVEFETGSITEEQLFNNFFADGRKFDGAGLVECMSNAYRYIDGMPELLEKLSHAGYEMHAFSNYPNWYKYIENKLQLGRYMKWTFVSCEGPMRGFRKPSSDAYAAAIHYFKFPPNELLFVDDRQVNVEAAAAAGLQAVRFQGAEQLEAVLRQKGLEF